MLGSGVPMRVNDLVGRLEAADCEEARAVVRRMLDEGKVSLDENLFLKVVK